MRHYLDDKSMDDVAMERLRQFEPVALRMSSEHGYALAFSGGKDSCVILDLAKRAGVKFWAYHSLTTCDPPELVRFIKDKHPEVEIIKPAETMWQLICRKGMPPRRNARFCCEVLKENGGSGHIVVTGVRWGESARRSKRKMNESCYRDKTKRFLHPIIDWSTSDVWTYIRERGLDYCCLYDQGQSRVGCVLCPMTRDVAHQIARWPRIAAAWERAVKSTFKPDTTGRFKFQTPEEYWLWWLDRDASALTPDDDQPRLFFEDEEPTNAR